MTTPETKTLAIAVRPYQLADIPQIAQLYHNTIHAINVQHYSPDQVQAWSPYVQPDDYWAQRFVTYHNVYVAVYEDTIVGFTELGVNGHIDCFYVHHEWQRCGIGQRLMARLHAEAKQHQMLKLFAEVSITAQPFFLTQGFVVVSDRLRDHRGQRFQQFIMEKEMRSSGRSQQFERSVNEPVEQLST